MLEKQAKARRAEQEAAASRAQAALEAKIAKQAATDESKLAAADLARDEEQYFVASKIYLALSLSSDSNVQAEAKSRLEGLQDDGRNRLAKIDNSVDGSSPSVETLLAALDDYSWLERQFTKVPVVNREIRSHVAKQRRRPEFVAAASEPEAAGLIELAQQHEQNDQICCAFLVYEEAAKLAPAPSSAKARGRLEALKKDPTAVKAAESCRNLVWCHGTFEKAKRLTSRKPKEARQLLVAILEKAPVDSEIYQAARLEVAQLSSN
jgi:hypothetical protein